MVPQFFLKDRTPDTSGPRTLRGPCPPVLLDTHSGTVEWPRSPTGVLLDTLPVVPHPKVAPTFPPWSLLVTKGCLRRLNKDSIKKDGGRDTKKLYCWISHLTFFQSDYGIYMVYGGIGSGLRDPIFYYLYRSISVTRLDWINLDPTLKVTLVVTTKDKTFGLCTRSPLNTPVPSLVPSDTRKGGLPTKALVSFGPKKDVIRKSLKRFLKVVPESLT